MLCDAASSLTPVTMVSFGILRSRFHSIVSFWAPSVASLSASSFPAIPACPFTHCSDLDLVRIHAVVHRKTRPCFIPIQCSSMANFESLGILSGTFGGAVSTACRMANSSPIWFDRSSSSQGLVSRHFWGRSPRTRLHYPPVLQRSRC